MSECWMSITEAARRLSEAGDSLDRSTLSRYLKQHGEALPTRREGRSTLVEYEALEAHRGENIRLRPVERAAPSVAVPAGPDGATSRASSNGGRRFTGTQSDGAARKAMADAELREMELAERRRLLTPTAEVLEAGQEAISKMQLAFDRAVEAEAAQVSVKYGWDERQARQAFKAFTRKGFEAFHEEMLSCLDELRRAKDARDLDGDETAAASSQLQ